MTRRAWIPICIYAGIVCFVACVVCLIWVCPESPDMVHRYAPMADAFAAGDYRFAFHPRFGVLFSVLSGLIVCLTGMDGPHACQFVAVAFWALAGVPLWWIATRMVGQFAGYCAMTVYYLNADLFLIAADGWRDGCRTLPLLLTAVGFLRLCHDEDRGFFPAGSVCFSAGILLMALLRVDAYVVAGLEVVVYSIWAVSRHRAWLVVSPSCALLLATVLQSVMIHAYTGWWVPVVHLIAPLEALI